MSIYSMLKAALRAQGWILARVPEDYEMHAAELVDLLTEDNADGRARRFALASWLTYERPVIGRFVGETCILTIEGPIYCKHGFGYPLGSQMQTEFGWLNLAPVETGQLIDELRAAIDLVLMRRFTDAAMVPRQTSSRQPRDRFFDDHLAKTQIRSATPPVRHEEQDADDQ
jgi:hypothetical protein